MASSIIRVLGLCFILSLTGCASPQKQAGPTVDRPADARFVAGLPEGPVTPPPEPAEAAEALAAARTASGKEAQLEAFRIAAEQGSVEGRYGYATLLADGAAGRERMGEGFDMMLALAKQGHGQAAMFLWRLSKLSSRPNLNQHAPYWFNIARRSGDAMAKEVYGKLLVAERTAGTLPPGAGSGDYFDSAIRFDGPVKDSAAGVTLERGVAERLYPGWRLVSQALVQADGRSFDVMELENVEAQRVKLYFDVTDWVGRR